MSYVCTHFVCLLCRSQEKKKHLEVINEQLSSFTPDLLVVTQCEGPVMPGHITKIITVFQ